MASGTRERWLEAVRRHQLHPTVPADDHFWAPELEACSRERLEAIQSEKLPLAVAYMAEHSPLYRAKLAAQGVEPGDVRDLCDLGSLPVVTKDDMSRSAEAAPPWGEFTAVDDERWLSDGWQVFNTSGTSSAPRSFRYTEFDRELWAWADARAVYAMGVRRGRDVGMMLFGYGPHVAMWGLYHALCLMGVPQLAAGGLDSRARCTTIDRMRPTLLGCTPSYALHLASVMKEMGLDPAASSVRTVIALGEPVPESTAARIHDLWEAEVHQFYGCTEAAPSCGGHTCSHGRLHFLEDTHILETLDPSTWDRVPYGEPGVSVVTNLISESSPQIRFAVGDYTTLDTGGCECGRTHVIARGGFSGRADDMLNVRGVTLFPSAIEEVVRGIPELGEEFKIVLETRADLDELTLVVEARDSAADRDAVADLVLGTFRAQLELRPTVEVVAYGTLPKTEFKAKRVEDRR